VRRLILLVGLLALLGSPFGVSDVVHALLHAAHEHEHTAEPDLPELLTCSSDCTDDAHHHHPPPEPGRDGCPLCTPLAASIVAVIPPHGLDAGPGDRFVSPPYPQSTHVAAGEHGVHRGRAPPLSRIDPRT